MKHYILKKDLTDYEKLNLSVALNDIVLLIVEKREFLLGLGILVEVEV